MVKSQTELPVNDELNGHGPAHRGFGGRGNGFVKGIGMQGIAVIIDRIQGLQGGSDIVEINFLGMQRTARGLDMVFEHLGAFIGSVFFAQCFGPNPPSHPSNHGVLGVDPVAKEKAEIGCKAVDIHSPR